MADSSPSKTGSFSRLVGPPSPQRDGDLDPAVAGLATRWQVGRRRLTGLCRRTVESNVVALLSSGLATAIAILLAVSVYRLHDRVRALELHCAVQPVRWTDDSNSPMLDKVCQYQLDSKCLLRAILVCHLTSCVTALYQ